MKRFTFYAQSKFILQIPNKGRNMTVKFSDVFRNYSSFTTTDSDLAEKIRKHRWFREGRIKEKEPKEITEFKKKPVEVSQSVAATTLNELNERRQRAVKSLSLGGRRGRKPKEKEKVEIPEEKKTEEEKEVEDTNAVTGNEIQADDVESLLEAVEFFAVNYGIDKKKIKNDGDIKALCEQYNVTFNNYQL